MSTSSSGEEVEVNDMDAMNSDDVPVGHFYWHQEHIRKLASYVMSQVANETNMAPYNSVKLNWDNVTAEVGIEATKCQHKWKLLMNSVRTYRTMPEIVLDILSQNSRQDIAKFNKSLDQVPVKTVAVTARPVEKTKKKKRNMNPDHPKRPVLSGYSVYCKHKIKTLPQVGIHKMLKLAAMWKDLPESERVAYNTECRQLKEKYVAEVEKYAEDHPDDKEIQKTLVEENSRLKKKARSPFTKIEPKDEVADTTEDTLDDTIQTNPSDSFLISPKKSPKKKRRTEEGEISQDSSPLKKRKKVKKEKVWTGENMFVEQKFDSYKLDHPDLDDAELQSKLARKYAKMPQERKDKYKRKAGERNN